MPSSRHPTMPLVRPRRPGVPWRWCVAAFLVTAVVVCRVGFEKWRPAASCPRYTATAHVVQPPARLAVRSSDDDPRRAAVRANAMAELVAADRRAESTVRWKVPCAVAQESVQKARLEFDEAKAKLETRQRQAAEAANATAAATPRPSVVDNPKWLELSRKLAGLERQRDRLLADRTPAHPAVQDNAEDIADIRRRMTAIPRQVPSQAMTAGRAESAKTDNAEIVAALARAKTECDEKARLLADAHQALRRVEERQKAGTPVAVEPAQVAKNVPSTEFNGLRLAWSGTMAGLLMAFGVGMASFGRSMTPAATSVAEIEAQLGEPVLGVVPADRPLDCRKIAAEWNERRRTAVTLGLVLIAACPVVALLGLTGM